MDQMDQDELKTMFQRKSRLRRAAQGGNLGSGAFFVAEIMFPIWWPPLLSYSDTAAPFLIAILIGMVVDLVPRGYFV
jgi:hypothetical protein